MQFQELEKSYGFGLSKIYELVVNNDPCYAYLMKCNNIVDQKLVMAHVYAHSDFFKNNYWFSKTNRKMLDEIANHGVRIRRYIERYGLNRVEDFIDCCLSLENLIDYHSPFIVRKKPSTEEEQEKDKQVVHRPLPLQRVHLRKVIVLMNQILYLTSMIQSKMLKSNHKLGKVMFRLIQKSGMKMKRVKRLLSQNQRKVKKSKIMERLGEVVLYNPQLIILEIMV